MAIDLSFSDDVSLARVVADFRDQGLLAELYHGADPVEIAHRQSTPSGSLTYDSTLTVHNFGLATRMLSHCVETNPKLSGREWSRRCVLDLSRFDSAKFMESKIDEVKCEETQTVRCRLRVSGKLKDLFFLVKAPKLTVKAKVQALVNWGRFWFYAEQGSASAKLSNPVFDQSDLAKQIAKFEVEGLEAARKAPFKLEARGEYAWK
jgi:hypothetical protein